MRQRSRWPDKARTGATRPCRECVGMGVPAHRVLDLDHMDGRRCDECGAGISNYGPEATLCGECYRRRAPAPRPVRPVRLVVLIHPMEPGAEPTPEPEPRRRRGRMPGPLAPACASPRLQELHTDLLDGLDALREARRRAE